MQQLSSGQKHEEYRASAGAVILALTAGALTVLASTRSLAGLRWIKAGGAVVLSALFLIYAELPPPLMAQAGLLCGALVFLLAFPETYIEALQWVQAPPLARQVCKVQS